MFVLIEEVNKWQDLNLNFGPKKAFVQNCLILAEINSGNLICFSTSYFCFKSESVKNHMG